MIVVTGAAGFIGFHVARRLLDERRDVFGVDILNDYYDPNLKRARLALLQEHANFQFAQLDIADHDHVRAALPVDDITHIIHFAAQPGVRYSLEAPFAYERANTLGHLSMLELARSAPKLVHMVYASSSSVYGDRKDGPFRESDRCDEPASLYAATKRACELMSHTYAHLYGVKSTGLRFFTVYGEWGRPDMAVWSFTERVLKGAPITLYNDGNLLRDFTHVDDIAPAVARLLDRAPDDDPPHAIFNLGNSKPVLVRALVAAIASAAGASARTISAPAPRTEVAATFADHSKATQKFAFAPVITIEEGAPRFVNWYRTRYNV